MTEIRCVKCKRLLFKVESRWDVNPAIEIKCPKCGYINHIIGLPNDRLLNRDDEEFKLTTV